MGRTRHSCLGSRAQVSRYGRSRRVGNQACCHSRASRFSYIAQVRFVASAGGLRSVSRPPVVSALSRQVSRLGIRASAHGPGAGQHSRSSGLRSLVGKRSASGERIRGHRERFRGSNLVVEQTAPAEPFGVNGRDLKAGAAAHHGCSKPLAGWSLASVGVISGRLLSSSPSSA